jgi:hypothetical protein
MYLIAGVALKARLMFWKNYAGTGGKDLEHLIRHGPSVTELPEAGLSVMESNLMTI